MIDHLSDYYEFCEMMWGDWLQDPLQHRSQYNKIFDLNAMPEPYLVHKKLNRKKPFIFMTTNPGESMSHQTHSAILDGQSFISPKMSYSASASCLAEWYRSNLSGTAKHRIDKMHSLGNGVGSYEIMQVELCPWHSASLPNKSHFLHTIRNDPILQPYMNLVCECVKYVPTIGLSAIGPGVDLESSKPQYSDWTHWLLGILGISIGCAIRIPLTFSSNAVSSLALCQPNNGKPHALILMKGGNHFPSVQNCTPLVTWMRKAIKN